MHDIFIDWRLGWELELNRNCIGKVGLGVQQRYAARLLRCDDIHVTSDVYTFMIRPMIFAGLGFGQGQDEIDTGF